MVKQEVSYSMSESPQIDSVMIRKRFTPPLSERETVRFTPGQRGDIIEAAELAKKGVADIIREGAVALAQQILRQNNRPSRVASEEAGDGSVELSGSPDPVPEAPGKTGKGKRAPGA